MSHHRSNTISGTLVFSQKKILLKSGDILYYVRLPRAQKDYLHGDRVRARMTKRGDGSQLAEVEILALVARTREQLLARIIAKNGKRYISVLRDFGYYESSLIPIPTDAHEDDIFLVRFIPDGKMMIVSKFADGESFDIEERILFFTAGIRMDFPKQVESGAQRFVEEKETTLKYAISKRRDFRKDFVFTIDGRDAKDLDDAISIVRDEQGNFILSVHIADVAEYVREDSQLDREAILRATSVYTPGKVIPMLPEALSNDVCSLHPGESKLVLSCIMTIDKMGVVKKTELVEGVIESAHRGVYEEIQRSYEGQNRALCPSDEGRIYPSSKDTRVDISLSGGNRRDGNSKNPQSRYETAGQLFSKEAPQTLIEAITLSYELYEILRRRRQKEGKILFESAETVFELDTTEKGTLKPKSVHARSRVGAHMLIEEFMVIANEEVAKWCDHHGLPFLSRVHGLPPYNSMEAIRQIIAHGLRNADIVPQKNTLDSQLYQTLEPGHIREFLDTLGEDDIYRYSRLLLPKMAKALYADIKHRHFGLALEYYAHFTSPIRRYPDLQVHRIIKEKLRGTLTDARITHYKSILKKVARTCSERERAAEDIERAFDSLYAMRYMSDKVGQTLAGRVSGITEFAYFVELDSGIEVTVYLPRNRRYMVDLIHGILSTVHGKRVIDIGEQLQVQIVGVMEDERRIVGERI